MNHVTFNRYLMFSLCVRRLQMMLCICRTQHVYKILQVHVLCGLCVFFSEHSMDTLHSANAYQ